LIRGKSGKQSFHYDSIPTTFQSIDSLELSRLMREADQVLEADVHTTITSEKEAIVNLIEMSPCGDSRWYLISKEKQKGGRLRQPYKGLFLILGNADNKVIAAVKLAEHFYIQFTTPWEQRLTSELRDGSILRSKEVSVACSDVGDLSCWETVITRQWQLTCDGFTLNRTDTTRRDL
jgi:hypothetical protein